mgnify:CR=1 FL=1
MSGNDSVICADVPLALFLVPILLLFNRSYCNFLCRKSILLDWIICFLCCVEHYLFLFSQQDLCRSSSPLRVLFCWFEDCPKCSLKYRMACFSKCLFKIWNGLSVSLMYRMVTQCLRYYYLVYRMITSVWKIVSPVTQCSYFLGVSLSKEVKQTCR